MVEIVSELNALTPILLHDAVVTDIPVLSQPRHQIADQGHAHRQPHAMIAVPRNCAFKPLVLKLAQSAHTTKVVAIPVCGLL